MRHKNSTGQAVIEIAIFGAMLIFLIGTIIRTHLSYSFNLNHQVRAMKVAMQQSYTSSVGSNPNSSHNSASVLFIEDRLSPDLNKFNTIDRAPFIAFGAGTMTNRLQYPVDYGEVQDNLPIMDVFVNGQHFPLTTANYVFRIIYPSNPADSSGAQCPNDYIGGITDHGLEFYRCLRQEHEWDTTNNYPLFYSLAVNGTIQYKPTDPATSFDLLRNNWDTSLVITPTGQLVNTDDVPGCPSNDDLCKAFAWQWQPIPATAQVFRGENKINGVNFGLKNSDGSRNYPSVDTNGSLKEQTIYKVSQKPYSELNAILSSNTYAPYVINPPDGSFYSDAGKWHPLILGQTLDNYIASLPAPPPPAQAPVNAEQLLKLTDEPCIANVPPTPGGCQSSNITGVVILDPQAGDLDNSYDPKYSKGPQPGIMQEMSMYSWVTPPVPGKQGTYLWIKEGKLYNPETNQVVRSVSSKDHVDLISRSIRLSNNTQRFCRLNSSGAYERVPFLDTHNLEPNPVQACGDCNGANNTVTCFDPPTRILFIRTMLGDTSKRKWFTDVTKGLN